MHLSVTRGTTPLDCAISHSVEVYFQSSGSETDAFSNSIGVAACSAPSWNTTAFSVAVVSALTLCLPGIGDSGSR